MSSLDSQFLCIGTIFANDVLTHYRGKENVSDAQQVLSTRLFIIAVVALTYVLSLGNVSSVFAMGVWCFSGFTALFPIVVAALYWRNLTAAGAISGILAAGVSWAVLFYQAISQGALRTFILTVPLGGEAYEIMPVVVMITADPFQSRPNRAMKRLSFLTRRVLVTPKPSEDDF